MIESASLLAGNTQTNLTKKKLYKPSTQILKSRVHITTIFTNFEIHYNYIVVRSQQIYHLHRIRHMLTFYENFVEGTVVTYIPGSGKNGIQSSIYNVSVKRMVRHPYVGVFFTSILGIRTYTGVGLPG
jgi:hypothetical protein